MLWAAPPAHDLQALSGTDLITTVLAEGRSSRLVRDLREEKQLVESIDVDLHSLEQGSLVILEAICPSERLGRCITTSARSCANCSSKLPNPLSSSAPSACLTMGTVLPWKGRGPWPNTSGKPP